MRNKEWEPIPQRQPDQDELELEIPPLPPPPKEKPKSPYEKGEDITPSNYNKDTDYDEGN